MRTTLDIDDDILAAAKDLAKVERKTMGEIISELARKGLTAPAPTGLAEAAQTPFLLDDWPMFPRRDGGIVTTDLIRRIEEEIDAEDMVPWDHERDAPRIFEDEASTGPRKS